MNNDYFKELDEKIKTYNALQELKKRNQFLRQELEREDCLAHGLKPGAPMMTIDHSKVPVQPDN